MAARQQNTAIQEHPSLPEISLQLQLRNSEGQLVTYLEPTTKYLRNVYLIHQFLDTKENKTIIEKDGKLFEEIQYQQKASFKTRKQIATYGMVHEGIYVLVFRHDPRALSAAGPEKIHCAVMRDPIEPGLDRRLGVEAWYCAPGLKISLHDYVVGVIAAHQAVGNAVCHRAVALKELCECFRIAFSRHIDMTLNLISVH